MSATANVIRVTLLDLVTQRGPDKTICPSEVARALSSEDWRSLMPAVREVGQALEAEGHVVVTQKGQVVDPSQAKGPIRYRQARKTIEPE
ncbi:DUF3253 domain-containing protein [Nodosilinea sp. LEGE 06152]|uniref:DUF3253 domain-containing protein n=1 Tax=Nodosilinea sp. LEGE 06152 TaxID=2777966 RepID=UPI0018825C48|nr:DUF3253 domain-containing protein [Nodosilinea sp. LEGE 06152]MBE9157116.1 DUF3253 domain-containing protein [Nodosilinea sp. LEGE 06152]